MFKQGYSLKDQINTHTYTQEYEYETQKKRLKMTKAKQKKKKESKGNQNSMIHVIKLSGLISSQIVVIQSD